LALEQMKETLDAANSFESHDHNSTHSIIPRLEKKIDVSEGELFVRAEVPINIATKRLHYTRGSVDVDPQRTWGLVNGRLLYLYFHKSNERVSKNCRLNYDLTSSAPDLERMIDMVNDADPLNIYLGNPDLKTSYTHRVSLDMSNWIKSSQTSVYAYLNGSYTQRAIASGYALDPTTGVRRFKAYNVDGNWSVSGRGGFSTALGSRRQWSPQVDVTASYNKYTDMTGIGIGDPEPSKAYALNLSLYPQLTYEALGWVFNLGVAGQWTHSKNSGLYGAAPSNVGYVIPVFRTQGKLPAHLSLLTQIQMYKRVGMSDSALNKPQWVWTMSLQYAPDKKWVISLDGFDILRQLSPAQVTVNSQGRMETYTNTLPSYFMARVQYHINISPKKEIVQPRYY
ncbi:MAG: outer membrane beta-barrel family protein, partial [Muribaculaceae bacterium]|nr:outer membrane beta-barrel family protein [Muribaculaceae bacterium]